MQGKSRADQWQRYIRDKLDKALSARSAWFLFLLAFVVVYREVFETILFYAALWTQGNGGAILGGAGTAMIVLGVIGWAMLRYSRKLPIAQFFAYSSALIAVLAVVLAGKGVAALQEAGNRTEEHTSELQPLMRSSYAVFCLKNKSTQCRIQNHDQDLI